MPVDHRSYSCQRVSGYATAKFNYEAWRWVTIDLSGEAEGLLLRLLVTQSCSGPLPPNRDSCHRRMGKVATAAAWDELERKLRVQPGGSHRDWFKLLPEGMCLTHTSQRPRPKARVVAVS